MRESDDEAPVEATEGSLADGVGETDTGGYESTTDPSGDTDLGDDSSGDGTSGGDTYGDDGTSGGSTDDTYGDDGTSGGTSGDGTSGEDSYGDDSYGDDAYGDSSGDDASADGTYGDGGTVLDEPTDDGASTTEADETVTEDEAPFDDADPAQDNSPLEGIGFLIDEVREALFGEDDAGAAGPFDTDPVDLETETDLDLTGDGVVDRADLHQAASSLVFGVTDGHHRGHLDDGLIDG